MATRIPVVSVVGKSDSGKTTLMEGLIRALATRGWRVATVKHHIHDFDIDIPGKDSWRHARAGAAVTMISAPDKFGVVRKVDRERTLDELVEAAGAEVDILLTEGFKRAGDVRVEVSRAARSDELICTPDQLFALVTDAAHDVGDVPVFGLEDADGLAALIERTFLPAAGPAAAADARAGSAAPAPSPTGSGV
jgi:molybdopterin-guanine dinucleotide biosynthesis protein B